MVEILWATCLEIFWQFVLYLCERRNNNVTCQVVGSKQYSWDLPQRGLDIPCVLTFSGEEREVLKVQKLVEEISAYIATNNDDSDKEPQIKKQKINCLEVSVSAIDESAADKPKHRDTTGGDHKVGSS